MFTDKPYGNMIWLHVTILIAVLFCTGSDGVFSPNVTVISCKSRRVVIQVENAAEGGLIFIQGRGLPCTQPTADEKRDYEFDFELCDIEYDTKFRVVVQKKTEYQTGYDKVIPVMCLVDTSDLYVSSVVFPEEKLDSHSVNKTVRPTVRMRILSPDIATTVEEVSLNEKVLLSLKLDDPYLEDFDIKAKDCRAEMINLVKNECSADEELFPNFEKKSKGDVVSTFKVFRPTNMDDETEVDMSFTCTVAVCKGDCHQKLCGEIIGWGRKKRESDDEEDDVYEKVTCNTKLKVKAPKMSILDNLTSELHGQLCAEKVAVASVLAVMILTLVMSWIVCGYVVSKLRRISRMAHGPVKPSTLRRLSEKNINFARSVGRRLSSMLNLPVGYNMHDTKMMHESIPDVEPSPTTTRRRDSVTVSKINDRDSKHYVNEVFCQSSTVASPSMLRKRFVEKSVQTESDIRSLIPDEQENIKHSPVSTKKHPFGFITSISIKSGLTKRKNGPKVDCSPAVQGHDNPNYVSPTTCFDGAAGNDSIIEYSADDVPKVRKACSANEHKSDKVDLDPFANKLTVEYPENKYANLRKPSLNDGCGDEFSMVPFENVKTDAENVVAKQQNSDEENGSDDVCIVDEVISDPIEFVATHKLHRKISFHV